MMPAAQEVHESPSQSTAGGGGADLSFQATWEAEIRRITVLGQPGQKSL
jgi:hypothetical protein